MAIELNHTIVYARDSLSSARFLSEVLGLPAPTRFGPFYIVQTENAVSLDFIDSDQAIRPQHYAFLTDESDFDVIFERIRERDLDFWADPGRTRRGEINHNDGGRGVYFMDPNGHLLEIITRPYGSGG